MKNKRLTLKMGVMLLLTIVLGTVPACKKESNKTLTVDDPLVKSIMQLGFAKSDIKDAGKYYVVEGDMLFAKNTAIDLTKTRIDASQVTAATMKTDQTWTGSYVAAGVNVVVQIDPSMYAYQSEILGAMAEWNSVPSSLTFSLYTGTTPSPNLYITANNNLGENIGGEAEFPVNGHPGSEIFISTSALASLNYSPDQIQYVISHEFGHAIGFRHTDWVTSGESSDIGDRVGSPAGTYQIPNTPNQYGYAFPDSRSIMSYIDPGLSFTTLSAYDQVAFQFLYPVNGTRPAGPAPYNTSGNFIRNDDTGAVYMVMDGALRWIPNTNVLNGLFDFNSSLMYHYNTAGLANAVMGTTIDVSNGLVNDNNTGKVYFRELSVLRWIPNWAVKLQYHFNWNSVQYWSSISGFTIGPDM